MSMKRSFELPVSSAVSLFRRALLVGSVLGLVVGCAHRDAGTADSTVASNDTAARMTPAAISAGPAVESVSTGETTVGATRATTPAANPTPASAAATVAKATTVTSARHTAPHHRDSTETAAARSTTATSTTTTKSGTPAATPTTVAGAPPAARATAKADTGGKADRLLVSPQEYEGWKMFSVYCYRCHGVDAMGGGIAPNLRHSVSSEGSVTHDVFVTTVTNGRIDKGMPTWKALLSPEQIEDLWHYVTARSSGKLAPGRPHMAGGNNP